MATPRRYVEAPEVTPAPFGLLSVARVLDETGQEALRGLLGGVHYQQDDSGPSYVTDGACAPGPSLGTLTITVAAGTGTIDATGHPTDETYTVDWGDGSPDAEGLTAAQLDGKTHAYANGSYVLLVLGSDGYTARLPLTVAGGAASQTSATVSKEKVLTEGLGLVEGNPFVVYRLFGCQMPAGGVQAGAERARAALRLGEQRAVESVMAYSLASDDRAVDLTPTPGTPLHPVDGLALLEEYAGLRYGGQRTLHTPLGMALRLGGVGVLERQGTQLQTKVGSLVAAGGGYGEGALGAPAGAPAPDAGEAYLYISGQVVARRTAAIEVPPTPQLTNSTNRFVALAERPYVLTAEGPIAAVLVKTPFGVPQ